MSGVTSGVRMSIFFAHAKNTRGTVLKSAKAAASHKGTDKNDGNQSSGYKECYEIAYDG